MMPQQLGYLVGTMIFTRISRVIRATQEVIVFFLWIITVLCGIVAAVIFLCMLPPISLFWIGIIWCVLKSLERTKD